MDWERAGLRSTGTASTPIRRSGAAGSLRSPDPFLVLPMPVDGLSAILTGVGDHVAEPEGKHDDGDNPKHVDGEADDASQECDRKDCHHHNVRHPALTEQRVNASSLR